LTENPRWADLQNANRCVLKVPICERKVRQ
jgi:hypothetical protein